LVESLDCYRCDVGYHGETCLPVNPLKSEMKSNFSLVSQLESDWTEITGGHLAASHQGCGTIVSGESLYFHQVFSHISVSRLFAAVFSLEVENSYITTKTLIPYFDVSISSRDLHLLTPSNVA